MRRFERSPGAEDDIDVGNLVDENDGAPITIGYGRYGPNSTLTAYVTYPHWRTA